MRSDFGAYLHQYLATLMVPKDGTPSEALWEYASLSINKKTFPQFPVIMEGQYIDARDAKCFQETCASRIRLFRIVQFHPETIEFDIFQRLESDDPEALIRIEFEMNKETVLWSEYSCRNSNQNLMPAFFESISRTTILSAAISF